MRLSRLLTAVATVSVVVCLAVNANAVDLIGYYEFEGDDTDSSTFGNNGAAAGSVGFAAVGFRGQARDLTGGQINLPINANPGPSPQISFGGWANIDVNSFDGFMAIDNGGWDRGIFHSQTGANVWGIASGPGSPTHSGSGAAVGQWQYVVGTFDSAANQAILYIGNDNAATQTTATISRADAQNTLGELVIELGRYDGQAFDGQADDIFVFDNALTPHQANAIRNLRLEPGLDYSPADAELLFDLFDAGSGTVTIGDLEWTGITGLNPTNPGEVFDNGDGSFSVVLDTIGNGLIGAAAAVPEPSTMLIWLIVGLVGFVCWRRRRT